MCVQRSSLTGTYVLALSAYALGAGISLLLHHLIPDADTWLIALHLTGTGVFYWLWRQRELQSTKFQSFGAIVLLSAAAFRLIGAMDTAFYGMRLEQWPDHLYASSPSPLWTIFQGEALTVVGLVCVVAA